MNVLGLGSARDLLAAAVALVGAAVVLAGCDAADVVGASSTSSAPAASSSATAGGIRLVGPDGAQLPVRWVGPEPSPATPGDGFDVVSTLSQPKECGQQLLAGSLLAGGAWFVGIRPAALCAWQGEAQLPAGYGVGLLPAGGSPVVPWASTGGLVPGDPPRQVTNGTTDGTTVVWSETASTGLFVDNWRVFAASVADGVPHLVARAEELTGGGDLPFYDSTYALHTGRVYWSSARADVPPTSVTYAPQVLAKDVTGSDAIAVVATDADQPVATDRGVVVRTIASTALIGQDASGKAETQQGMAATGIALVTPGGLDQLVRIESDAPLPFGARVTALAGAGSHVAFAVGTTEYLLDLDTHQVTGFNAQGNPRTDAATDILTAPTVVWSSAMSTDLLAWSYGNNGPDTAQPVFVYRRATSTLRRVDVPLNAGQVWAVGNDVAWSVSDGTWTFQTVTSWGG